MKKHGFFTANILKIIAVVAMTFDHLGTIAYMFYGSHAWISVFYDVAKIIGRLALPIFIYLIFEGYKHTSNLPKYFLRLAIMGVAVYAFENIVAYTIPDFSTSIYYLGNIFVDLILVLLMVTLFYSKIIWQKCLIILPIMYFVFTMFLQCSIIPQTKALFVITNGLVPQYPLATPFIVLIYIGLHSIYKIFEKNQLKGAELDEETQTSLDLRSSKFTYAITLLLLSITMHLLTYTTLPSPINSVSATYFVIGAVPILFYNGLLGKKSKKLQYAFYLYYPLHLVIIFLIFYLAKI